LATRGVDLSAITREQKVLAAAGACVLFIVFLFLPWFGFGGEDISGWDAVPSSWVLLIFAILATVILVADAFRFEIPIRVSVGAAAAYLTSVLMIVTVMFVLEPVGGFGGREWGIFLALVFAIIAFLASLAVWQED
jgi:hypothetical protein